MFEFFLWSLGWVAIVVLANILVCSMYESLCYNSGVSFLLLIVVIALMTFIYDFKHKNHVGTIDFVVCHDHHLRAEKQ